MKSVEKISTKNELLWWLGFSNMLFWPLQHAWLYIHCIYCISCKLNTLLFFYNRMNYFFIIGWMGNRLKECRTTSSRTPSRIFGIDFQIPLNSPTGMNARGSPVTWYHEKLSLKIILWFAVTFILKCLLT